MSQHLRLPSILLALPSIQDPNFAKSIVLLVQHNPDGALGFVMNRPLPVSLRDVVVQSRLPIPSHIPVWLGGPLGKEEGLVIHNQGGDSTATTSAGDLRVSSSDEAMQGLTESMDPALAEEGKIKEGSGLYPYRFVVGYAGWGPKQLDGELKAGHWLQIPLDMNLLFAIPYQEMWAKAVESFGVHPLDIMPTSHAYLN